MVQVSWILGGHGSKLGGISVHFRGPDVPNSRAHEIWGDGFKFHGCEPEAWAWSILEGLERALEHPARGEAVVWLTMVSSC